MGEKDPLTRLMMILLLLKCTKSGMVPAMYIFGDSLVDVGNNNFLKFSIAKANFPHYGLDFPSKTPTGRFCNGKNAADYLSEKLGLAYAPPYLTFVSKSNANYTSFLTGVNFASGGAGILNQTNHFKQSIHLTEQVDYFLEVHDFLLEQLGFSYLQTHLSKSLFLIEIGSNDLFRYFQSSKIRNNNSTSQHVELMSINLELLLKHLYQYGARKMVIVGVGAIGCVPAMRSQNRTEECNEEMNYWSEKYNDEIKTILQKLHTEIEDFYYSYFDSYKVMLNCIQSPSLYGFVEVKNACCGIGKLKAMGACMPMASYCSNREDNLFWDQYHPTQQAHLIFTDYIYDGPLTYTSPLSVQKLISI